MKGGEVVAAACATGAAWKPYGPIVRTDLQQPPAGA